MEGVACFATIKQESLFPKMIIINAKSIYTLQPTNIKTLIFLKIIISNFIRNKKQGKLTFL